MPKFTVQAGRRSPSSHNSNQFYYALRNRIRENLTNLFCKRVKRGTDGVSISRIGVAIAVRRIKTTRMGGIVIVAGTQPAGLIKTVALKVRFLRRAFLRFFINE